MEKYDVKYMADLKEYWNDYSFAVINEIYVGIAINLGMSPADAYKLAKTNPNELRKGFFKNTSTIFTVLARMFLLQLPDSYV